MWASSVEKNEQGDDMKIWAMILALALTFTGMNADAARRMGGGKSVGQQSSNVTQREATRAPGGATQNAAPAPAPAAPAAAPVAPRKPWGAMLGGLAAGLGLAWLAHSMGFGEGFGQILMFGLLAFGVMMAVGWFMRSRRAAQAGNQATPFAYQGATQSPSTYRPENVGNDASARPWERNTASFDAAAVPAGGSMIGSALKGSQSWGVPADFDAAGFLGAAKANFVSMQAAWDVADIAALRAMMTDGMLAEIKGQLAERDAQTGSLATKTEVVMLNAELLGIEERATDYMASVEFSGMLREDPSAGPSPFREVWNMTKPRNGGGWLVAGVQALQ
jgi:predicted lipid-binding transport protein (Tim44 family)